jgi:hypothetical protein
MNTKIKLFLLLVLSVLAVNVGCYAKSEENHSLSSSSVAKTDTIMQKALGDSLYRVISHARKIEISTIPPQTDSVSQKVTLRVSSKRKGVLNFIVSNPKNYLSNTIVYGVFMPQFQVNYYLKQELVTLKYDFGLKKWGIFDAMGNIVCMFDLASDNMLRFAHINFPDIEFFFDRLMEF